MVGIREVLVGATMGLSLLLAPPASADMTSDEWQYVSDLHAMGISTRVGYTEETLASLGWTVCGWMYNGISPVQASANLFYLNNLQTDGITRPQAEAAIALAITDLCPGVIRGRAAA